MKSLIDPVKRAEFLRKTLIKKGNTPEEDKILVAVFENTLQGKDTGKVIPSMPNVATKNLVFRTKYNVKEIDPLASKAYAEERGTKYRPVSSMFENKVKDLIKRADFDFPLWYMHQPRFDMKRVLDYNNPFMFQVAGCNFHDGTSSGGCWYCFVDDASNDGVVKVGKEYLGIGETLDSMAKAKTKVKALYKKRTGTSLDMQVLRSSGGEPTIVLDWILKLWEEVGDRAMDIVGQLDTNLSTGRLIEEFEKDGIYRPNILSELAEYPIKVLTAIKGTDPLNLESNVQAKHTLELQTYSLKKFINADHDCFIQMYNPNPHTLGKFLMDMDRQIENFSLRVHIGPLHAYGPTLKRLKIEAKRRNLDPEMFIKEKKKEWNDNYKNGSEVLDSYLTNVHKCGYKDTVRSDVKLKVKR